MKLRKEAIDFAKWYCNVHGIKYRSFKSKSLGGKANFTIRTIYINIQSQISEDCFLSILFHEVMHIKCMHLKIFPLYHTPWTNRKYAKSLPNIRRQAFRAEKKVDELAKEEMLTYFPDLKFYGGYLGQDPDETKKFLLEYYK